MHYRNNFQTTFFAFLSCMMLGIIFCSEKQTGEGFALYLTI